MKYLEQTILFVILIWKSKRVIGIMVQEWFSNAHEILFSVCKSKIKFKSPERYLELYE